jgi:hypothetical protein
MEIQNAKWYQIFTNGAMTIFARYFVSPDSTGEFEKMEVDHVDGTIRPYGFEHYYEWEDAKTRLRFAIEKGE